MTEKPAVTHQLAVEYKRAAKKKKGGMLDASTEVNGYSRSQGARVQRQRT